MGQLQVNIEFRRIQCGSDGLVKARGIMRIFLPSIIEELAFCVLYRKEFNGIIYLVLYRRGKYWSSIIGMPEEDRLNRIRDEYTPAHIETFWMFANIFNRQIAPKKCSSPGKGHFYEDMADVDETTQRFIEKMY